MAWGKSEAQRTVAREQDINSKLRKQYTHATEGVQIACEAQATTALEADIVKIDTSRLRAELEPLSADEVARREAAHKEAARAFSTWSSRVHELKNQLKDSDRNLAAAQRSVARELYIAY